MRKSLKSQVPGWALETFRAVKRFFKNKQLHRTWGKCQAQNEIARYYEQIKNEKHIFIYSVCGRSSSTAVQRILNSSDEVCIYGEPHYIVDKMVETMDTMRKWDHSAQLKKQFEALTECFQCKKHDQWYANATRPLDRSIRLMAAVLADMLRPMRADIKRFGYKEIRIVSIETLKMLREVFPRGSIVFVFRDPLTQWPSIESYIPREYDDNMGVFLDEYRRIAQVYLEFFETNGNCIFIENIALTDGSRIERFVKKIGLSKFDEGSLTLNVRGSTSQIAMKKELTGNQRNEILSSQAYACYLKMKSLGEK